MAISVQQVIADVIDHVADNNKLLGANPYMLGLINSVHQQLCIDVEVLSQNTQVPVTLVAGQYIYTLPTTVKRIRKALYQQSAGSTQWTLIPTSQGTLNEQFPGWQDTTIQVETPGYYFDDQGNLGIYPIPNATSSGGYPVVTVYCTEIPILGPSDYLPANVARDEAWVYAICALYCIRHKPEAVADFLKLAEMEKANLLRAVRGLIFEDKPTIRVARGRIRTH